MGRSLKKGPYVVERLLEKVYKAENTGNREPIKTWARACTIVPEFVGRNFAIHNGKNFIKLFVTERENPVECSGKICWGVESKVLFKQEKRFDTGIEFLDILPEDRDFIRKMVDSKMKEAV